MNYNLIENTSKIYYNGSVWKTNNYGNITIIGRVDCIGKPKYLYMFEDGTVGTSGTVGIKSGQIKNYNYPTVHGIGFIGQGDYSASIGGKPTRNYRLWSSMIQRCYSDNYQKRNKSYKGCIVSKDWHNFQIFSKDIKELDGYDKWISDDSYQLDKDKLFKLNNVYSKEKCCFIPRRENFEISNISGLTYVAIREIDGYEEEFTNQSKFSKKYNLNQASVNEALNLGYKYLKSGWDFKIKNY